MIVGKSGTGAMMDVIETMGDISSDLHPGDPIGKNSKVWIFRVSETNPQIGTFNKFIDEINAIP